MGLTKSNYYSKSTGITLPIAYAVLKDLVLNGTKARAIFVIQSSRNATQNFVPIDKTEVNFEWDRKSNLAEMAYEKAKTQNFEIQEGWDEEKHEPITKIEYGLLYGWNNDIVK